jgi:hypothetical protein
MGDADRDHGDREEPPEGYLEAGLGGATAWRGGAWVGHGLAS